MLRCSSYLRVPVAGTAAAGYAEAMTARLDRRIVLLLALFFFALSGVMHGFAAAAVNGEMPSMAAFKASDEGCGYCSGDDGISVASAVCQAVCSGPALIETASVTRDIAAAAHLQTAPSGAPPGRGGPPDPHPPRPVSLS